MNNYLQYYFELNKLYNQVECGSHLIYLFFGNVFICKISLVIKIILSVVKKKKNSLEKKSKRMNPYAKSNWFTEF